MRCRNCGVELEPEARFCQDCGTPVDGQPARSSFKPAQANTGSKRSPRTIAIGIICVAAVIAIAFAAASALGLGGPRSSGASSTAAASASSSSASAASSSAQASSASSSKSSSSASKSSKSAKKEEPTWDATKAEAKARKDARAAGMQVFTGTVHFSTYKQRAADVSSKLVKSVSSVANDELVLIDFVMKENLSAVNDDTRVVESRPGQGSIAMANPWDWEGLDGRIVTVAAFPEDLIFPSSAAGYLFSAYGNVLLIAPLSEASEASLSYTPMGQGQPLPELPKAPDNVFDTSSDSSKSAASSEASAASSEASATANGDYVLADSATRTYTKDELSKLSDYELFIARNEIYARHGRKFQSADLQSYFDSKSWYKATTSAADFTESVLSSTELANASLIREVEEARNSKYL